MNLLSYIALPGCSVYYMVCKCAVFKRQDLANRNIWAICVVLPKLPKSEISARSRHFRVKGSDLQRHKPDCVFWNWLKCQSQRLDLFDGSSNWDFTYPCYNLFSYNFDVSSLHTRYHFFVNHVNLLLLSRKSKVLEYNEISLTSLPPPNSKISRDQLKIDFCSAYSEI